MVSSLASIAHLLNLPEQQEQDQNKMMAAVTRWLNNHRDWLLIVDNVEDLDLLKGMLPAIRQGSLLLTTRLHTLETLAQCVLLGPLNLEESAYLLLQRSGHLRLTSTKQSPTANDASTVRTLVEDMGGLLLALDQAGAYIEKTQCSISDFLHLFEAYPLQLLQERHARADHPFSVVRTFTLVFDKIQQDDTAAADLLRLCCFLAPDEIPEAMLTQSADHLSPVLQSAMAHPLQWNATLQALLTYALILRNSQTKTISLHTMIKNATKRLNLSSCKL